MAWLVLLLGLAGSLTAALLWRRAVRTHVRQSFQTSAATATGTIETELRRDSDFVRSVRAVLSMEANIGATRLDEWFSQLEDREAEPLGFGATVTRLVPASSLRSFLARRNADPAFRRFVGGHVEPFAANGRPFYCLLSAGSSNITYAPALDSLLQGDWCDPSSPIGGYRQNGLTRAQATQAITSSGQLAVYTLSVGGQSSMVIEGAFYRHGATLANPAERRAAVLGWMSGSFNVPLMLSTAVGGLRRYSVTLYHTNPGLRPELIGRLGPARLAHPLVSRAHLQTNGDWLVEVRGAPSAGFLSADDQAIVLGIGGAVTSMLMFLFVLVLSGQRERALGLVRQRTRELAHLAHHDSLTGLPNRGLALDRATQMLARARRQGLPVAALYIDVDGFKQVNDSFGHGAGDELLRLVAQRLAAIVREGDTAARLGGDEFVVLVEGSTLDAGPELVAERLLEALREPYDIGAEGGRALLLSASVGIAYGLRGDAEELLRDADVALYEAKAAGKNRYVLFESAMQTARQDRATIQMDLAEALEREQLFLVYQPTFDLRSERAIGFEALLRWRHPTRGVVMPADFIPVAERSGLIAAIGRWVLNEACARAAGWRARGHDLGIWVNVSARQLDSDELIEDVRSALAGSGLDASALTLEVTETTIMRDPDAAVRRLGALKSAGVRIAIDDFGTGYSSLSYLRRFPADALKIDRSFVAALGEGDEAAALIETFVQLGRTLRVDTLAEGIEDRAQLRVLQSQQCDLGQGFFLSLPLDAAAVEAFLGQTDALGLRSG